MSRPAGVRWAIAALACAMLTAGVACRRRAPDAPPVATPSLATLQSFQFRLGETDVIGALALGSAIGPRRGCPPRRADRP